MRYLDIETILSEEERIPCEFLIEAKGLFFLDINNTSIDNPLNLSVHTIIELPIWLSIILSDRNMIKINLPKHFGSKMRDEIMASSLIINLRDYSYYYFIIGIILCKLMKDNDLQRSLRIAFCGDRYNALLVRCLTGGNNDNSEFSQSLTSTEYKIFQQGYQTTEELKNWHTRKSYIIQQSNLLKRKVITTSDNDNNKKNKS